MITPDKLSSLLPSVIDIARQAGRKIMKIYDNKQYSVSTKLDRSPITQADLAAHECIVGYLQSLTPDIAILSEESDIKTVVPTLGEQFWLVDPLDGTKEFIHRTDEFTVNIALIDRGQPVLGAVYLPCTEALYTGLVYENGIGLGDRQQGQTSYHHRFSQQRTCRAKFYQRNAELPLVASRFNRPLKQAPLRVLLSRRHGRTRINSLLTTLRRQFARLDTMAVGSSLKLCWLAQGRADLYPRLGPTHLWDVAAAHAVLRASGGEVINQSGQPLQYHPKKTLKNPYFFAVADPQVDWYHCLNQSE